MNLLDENIRADQAERLRDWGIPCREIIGTLTKSGTQDPDILRLLHRLKNPTFFTHDQDYFLRSLRHPAYCLVWLDTYDGDAAVFIRQFLRHPRFNTHAQRMGVVARTHPDGVLYWDSDGTGLHRIAWPEG